MSKKQVIDERFKRITYDPSFKSMKKDEKKIKIDKRFAGVLNDPKFKLVSKTDKYGNPIEIEEGLNKEMEEMYYQEDSEEESKEQVEKDQGKKEKKDKKKEKKDKKKDNEEEEEQSKEKKKQKKQKKAAPKDESEEDEEEENEHDRSFSWHEVSSSDEELEFEDEDGIENEDQFHYGVTNEKAPVSEDSSSKLALLNYDWMNITAADILLLFNSFKDKNAVINKVSVYPSEYGLTMLQKEIEEGPNNIWKQAENQKLSGTQAGAEEVNQESDDDSDHDKPSKKKDKKSMKQQEEDKKKENALNKKNNKNQNNEEDDGKEKGDEQNQTKKFNKKEYKAKSLFESRKANFLNHTVVARVDDDQCDIDPVKLREYERQRMRYYYAVIECDSKSTADKIYTQCDGMEFEMSGIPIDLRFVPEDQVFPYEPKEVCDEVPADSQVKNISNRSVGHTNAKLTWDQPQDRFKFMDGKMTEKDYAKIDWSKYIAPCEENNNEDELNENIEDEEESNEELGSDDEIAKLEKEALRQQQEIDNLNWRKQFDKKGRKKQSDGQIEITFNQGFDDIGNRILERQKAKNETIFETRDRQRQEKRQLRKQEIKEKMNKNKKNKLGAATDNSEDAIDKKRQKEYLELLIDKEDDLTQKDKEVALDDPRFKAIYETNDYSIDPNSKFFNKQTSSRMLQEQITRRKKQKLNQD